MNSPTKSKYEIGISPFVLELVNENVLTG
jgi:hypothetical protein